ncbi:Fructosamine/Ketosamine-3-kinase, partial [Pseudomassariella vexata]
WSSGYKIDVEVDGEEKEYFLKVIHRPNHAEMALGEFEKSQKAMFQYIPNNVSIPLAYGTFEHEPKSFFLTIFRELRDKTPDPSKLVHVLEKLHTLSSSPTGKFGFHVSTFNGVVPIINEWCDTWEEYFSRQFQSDIRWEQSIRGPDSDFDKVSDEFFQKVVPRLLRPLQTGGRSIKPTLVHGDLWHGNAQIDMTTEEVILFDSCCCYAHNELELHMMREPRYRFTGDYISKYKEVMQPSEPKEDFDDRNSLYAIVKEEMQRLIDKYPTGFDSF